MFPEILILFCVPVTIIGVTILYLIGKRIFWGLRSFVALYKFAFKKQAEIIFSENTSGSVRDMQLKMLSLQNRNIDYINPKLLMNNKQHICELTRDIDISKIGTMPQNFNGSTPMNLAAKIRDLSDKAVVKIEETKKEFLEFYLKDIYSKVLDEIYKNANLGEKCYEYTLRFHDVEKAAMPYKLQYKHIKLIFPEIIKYIANKLKEENFDVKVEDTENDKRLIIKCSTNNTNDPIPVKKSWWKIW